MLNVKCYICAGHADGLPYIPDVSSLTSAREHSFGAVSFIESYLMLRFGGSGSQGRG